jgi:uncharacterized protein
MGAIEVLVLLAASVGAGAVNAIAGGGSFLTLPALILFNVPPVTASATAAVAVWPGLASGAWGYRRRLLPHWRFAAALCIAALAGGLAGGYLVLLTPAKAFSIAIPFLMLFASVLFIAGPRLARRAGGDSGEWAPPGKPRWTDWRLPGQFAVGVVTGYFNASGGVLAMAALSAFGIRDVQLINALKLLLGVAMTGASVVAFALAGQVDWPYAVLMTAGTVVGGHGGAILAQRLPASLLRTAIAVFSLGMTAYFFAKFLL